MSSHACAQVQAAMHSDTIRVFIRGGDKIALDLDFAAMGVQRVAAQVDAVQVPFTVQLGGRGWAG